MKHVMLMLMLAAGGPQVGGAQEAPIQETQTQEAPKTIVAIKVFHVPPSMIVGWIAPVPAPVLAPGAESAQAARARSVFALPEGIDAIVPSEAVGEVWVRGTAKGIQRMRDIIGLLDRPLRRVEMRLRALRVDRTKLGGLPIDMTMAGEEAKNTIHVGFVRRDAEPVVRETLARRGASEVLEGRLEAINNTEATLQTSAQPPLIEAAEARITPTINNDRTVTLVMAVSAVGSPALSKTQAVLNMREGDTVLVVVPDEDANSTMCTLAFVTARILPLPA